MPSTIWADLRTGGTLDTALGWFGIDGPGFGNVATWLVFTYLWLPYMIIPIYAGLERLPISMLDASSDLGHDLAGQRVA